MRYEMQFRKEPCLNWLNWFPNSYLGTGSLLKFYFPSSC